MKIQYGSTVTLHFTLRLVEQDILVDSTSGEDPMTFVMGDGDLVEGMEMPLLGLKVGDIRRFEVACEDAYGPDNVDEDKMQNIPVSEFPQDLDIGPGLVVGFTSPSGDEIAGTIMGFTDEIVTVNFDHPLAGHDLVFEVEILEIKPPQ